MRSCVPPWVIKTVYETVKNHGLGAHEVLFPEAVNEQANVRLVYFFEAICGSFSAAHPELYKQIRSRVWAATRFNGNAKAVKQLLSM